MASSSPAVEGSECVRVESHLFDSLNDFDGMCSVGYDYLKAPEICLPQFCVLGCCHRPFLYSALIDLFNYSCEYVELLNCQSGPFEVCSKKSVLECDKHRNQGRSDVRWRAQSGRAAHVLLQRGESWPCRRQSPTMESTRTIILRSPFSMLCMGDRSL
jgi:hypothetical protein